MQEKRRRRLERIAWELRGDIVAMVANAKSGHCGGPLGLAEVFSVLYFHSMRHDAKKPLWRERDRLYLSNGHVCAVLYAALARSGYFPPEELLSFRKLGSRLQGHPHRNERIGIETTAGMLGQGLSVSVGAALAARLDKSKRRVYCVASDGECQEGSTWEAAMAASNYNLSNLTLLIDYNNVQISGHVSEVMRLEPFAAKWKAFGWNVLEARGNDVESVAQAIEKAKLEKSRPTAIICRTTLGKGVSFMEDNPEWHGKPPDAEQARRALEEISERLEKL
ncbi:transketolase [Candidatus Micrarchaeota archaeon CG1_02_55_22]|nr:MAG: transketolase [Candidatus Micrarchaeota archaeon CG1_02_55_22]